MTPTSDISLTIAVFSYNRGGYLQNCLASIARHAPGARLRIYDDGSDDAGTRAVLAQHVAALATGTGGMASKHGGLYGNMQAALDDCTTDLLMFVQDDMQLVRGVTGDDLAILSRLFDADPDRAFVCPTFMKGIRQDQAERLLRPLPGLAAYGLGVDATPDDVAARYAYADVSLAHVARLRGAGWRFQNRERLNVAQARAMFSDMPYLAAPFVHFCPEVPVFRQRRVTLAARLAARIAGTDVKAFHDLTAPEVTRLIQSPPTERPVAEAWLRPVNPHVRRPFVYQDVKVRPWLALLHRIETALRRR